MDGGGFSNIKFVWKLRKCEKFIRKKHFQNVTIKHWKSFFELFSIAHPNALILISLREFIFPCIHFTLGI